MRPGEVCGPLKPKIDPTPISKKLPSTYLAGSGRAARNLFGKADFAAQRAFFAARPELQPTPTRLLPALAQRLGIRTLAIKDETQRFGLNAFKAVGATFAIATLRARGVLHPGATLACASEGNHGRAVARGARDGGCKAVVYVAESVAEARVAAIEAEGARVHKVGGTYDDAVRTMVADAGREGWTIISDTSWPGYDAIPRLIMLGYTRMFDEAESQMPSMPDVIFVQAGVGGLLAAAACWAEERYAGRRPRVVAVEPAAAACVQASARANAPTTLRGPFETVMGGLRCGEMSPVAFDAIQSIVDGYIAIEDDWAFDAMRLLAAPMNTDPQIQAGASGAASLAGLLATLREPSAGQFRQGIGLDEQSMVLAIATEGVTDPAAFSAVVSRP
jgi:diaminopropionate ammonia-lyase